MNGGRVGDDDDDDDVADDDDYGHDDDDAPSTQRGAGDVASSRGRGRMEGRARGQRVEYGGVVSHLLRREALGDVRTPAPVPESKGGGVGRGGGGGGGGQVSNHGRGDARGGVQSGIPGEVVGISSKSAKVKSAKVKNRGDYFRIDDGDDDDDLGGGSEFMGFLRSASQSASQASKSVISSVSSDHHSSVAPAANGGSSRQARGSTLASQSPRRGLLPDI